MDGRHGLTRLYIRPSTRGPPQVRWIVARSRVCSRPAVLSQSLAARSGAGPRGACVEPHTSSQNLTESGRVILKLVHSERANGAGSQQAECSKLSLSESEQPRAQPIRVATPRGAALRPQIRMPTSECWTGARRRVTVAPQLHRSCGSARAARRCIRRQRAGAFEHRGRWRPAG